MPVYQIKRGSEVITEVFAQGNKTEGIMDVTIAQLQFNLPYYEDFKFGDSVMIDELMYKINSKPLWTQLSAGNWQYTLQFQAEHYDLNKVQLLGLDSENNPTETEFSYTGTALGLIDMIILNINRVYPTWTRGTVDETDIRTFEFKGETTRYGLTQLADVYGIEYWFDGKTINFTSQGVNTGLIFERGRDKGLTEVGIESQDNNFATRWLIEGSDKNIIPSEYGHKRLQLANGLGYIEDPAKVALYGVIEGTVYFDDIMPSRTAAVTSVVNYYTFRDSTIDFDINDARVSNDIDPKVVFKTGLLAGLSFTIQSYDNATKTIVLVPNSDGLTGQSLPSEAIPVEVTDTYTLIDINLPSSYIDTAEDDLQEAGEDFYEKNSDPKTKFRAPVDPIFLGENNIDPKLGDYVTINIPEAGVSKLIRIIRKTVDLEKPLQMTLEFADQAVMAAAVRQYIRQENINKEIGKVTQQAKDAMAQATNAKRTAEIVASVTSFLSTTIEGNVVATGTLIVGDALGNNNAGISGVIESGDPSESVWLWGGTDYANRENAPFRVQQDGTVYMTKANITSSPTGPRIQISGSENSLSLLNSDSEQLVLLDDDSANEGTMYFTTTPPLADPNGNLPKDYLFMDNVGGVNRYYYANMGPGISVGISPTDVGGFSYMSRKEVGSNGRIQAISNDTSTYARLNSNGNIQFTGSLFTGPLADQQGATENVRWQAYNGSGVLRIYEFKFINGIYISRTDVT